MKKIIGYLSDIEVKRFYFEGSIKTQCPSCRSGMELDFEDHPLTEPEIEVEEELIITCDNCEKEWLLPVVIRKIEVTLEYNDKEMKEWE